MQYERTQQMIQQQLLYTQMQIMQQQQDKDGGGTDGGVASSSATSTMASHSMRGIDAAGVGGVIGGSRVGRSDGTQYINGSDVMIGSHSQSQLGVRSQSSGEEGDASPREAKKVRLDTSTGE